MNFEIDITLVAGARPDLLSKTLDSFSVNLFQNFTIRQVFANIDPIFGGAAERKDCVALVRKYFPDAIVFTPEKGSFGGAVKRLWESTSDAHVLHLEDDWLMNEALYPLQVFPHFTEDTGMIVLSPDTREKTGGDYLYITRRKRILGYEIYSRRVNAYGTSPRFIRSGLCRLYGQLLRPEMDPEKQVYKNKNRALARAHTPWKCRTLFTLQNEPLITDIGREWRAERDIIKLDRRGYAVWMQKGDRV